MAQAPSVFDASGAGGGKGKGKAAQSDSEDDEGDILRRRKSKVPDWGSLCFELMVQLRDVLRVSELRGWNLFMSSDTFEVERDLTPPPSPSSPRSRFRRGTSSSPTSDSPASPTSPSNPTSGTSVLNATLSVLSEICLLASTPLPAFRPSMPPLGLQSVTLDVAIVILACCKGKPKEMAAVGMSMLGAVESWGEGTRGRVLEFFEALTRESLERLGRRSEKRGLRSAAETRLPAMGGPVPPVAILVDEPTDGPFESPRELSSNSLIDIGRRATSSTYAGDQPLVVYHLSSLVAPLLSVALAAISPLTSSMDTLYRLHRLLESLLQLKPDLYLDLLEVVAYNSAARFSALAVLSSFWPKAIGQPSVSAPFPRLNYRDDVWRLETQTMRLPPSASERALYLVPWRFPDRTSTSSSRPSTPSSSIEDRSSHSPPSAISNVCLDCGQAVTGFGLLSLSSLEPLHLECNKTVAGSFITHYVTPTSTNRIAAARYSFVPPSRREIVLPPDDDAQEASMPAPIIPAGAHRFHLVNLFTLPLCVVCNKPLWGTVLQGYLCSPCRNFAHHDCLADPSLLPPCRTTDSSPISKITIDHTALRQDFVAFYRESIFDEAQLARLSYEELSAFHLVLWTQQQILDAGVASGTIVISQTGPTKKAREAMDRFELHWLVQLYDAYRANSKSSAALEEFRDMHSDGEGEVNVDFFSLELLVFVAALVRSPSESASQDHLSAGDDEEKSAVACYDRLHLSLVRELLARDFALRSRQATQHVLDHLLHLGLFERQDGRLLFPPSTTSTTVSSIIFPLPFLIDPSPSVESLVVAIESSLRDTDLSVQEAGLLMLVRRCWPSPFASEYTLERLTRAVIRWILDDSTLFEVTREKAASMAARYAHPDRVLPPRKDSRIQGDYLEQRKRLVARLASRWLRALCDQDPQQYSEFLFSQTALVSAASKDSNTSTEHTAAFTELLLKNLIRLHHTHVVFSTFDGLFARWLDEVASTWESLKRDEAPLSFRSLTRLFQSQDHARSRSSTILAGVPMSEEPSSTIPAADSAVADPWQVLLGTSVDGQAGLRRSLRWLRILAQSGVDATVETLDHLAGLCESPIASFADSLELAEALFAFAWSRSVNRRGIAAIASRIFSSQHHHVKSCLDQGKDMDAMLLFIRRTLAAYLLAANCSPDTLVSLGFALKDEVRILGSSRKRYSFVQTGTSDIECGVEFLDHLTRQCQCEVFAVRATIAKFLFALLASKTAISSRDSIIQANAGVLSSCVFRLFDLNQPDLTGARIKLLLVLLSVEGPTFHRLLALVCTSQAWEHRFTTIDTLFLMLTEFSIPASGDTPAGSLSQFYPIISSFFVALWDPEEAVRQKVGTLIQSLRPSHLAALRQSIQARFIGGDVAQQTEICVFLTSIRASLPAWQVLTWASVLDGLFAQELNSQISVLDATRPRDGDGTNLWLHLLVLALAMVAEGFELDKPSTVSKIKYHAFKALGFSDVSLNPSIARGGVQITFGRGVPVVGESFLPILASLKRVLDCSRLVMARSTAERSPDQAVATELVGAAFVDVVPLLVSSGLDFGTLTYIQLRDILECLSIIVYKHSVDESTSSVVPTIRSLAALLLLDTTSYDNRLFILLVSTSFLKRYHSLGAGIVLHQIPIVLRLLEAHPDDALGAQAKTFLRMAFLKFSLQGLFMNLFKRALTCGEYFASLALAMQDAPDLFEGDHQASLRETPFFDVFRHVLSAQPQVLDTVLANLSEYGAKVHGSNWSLELLQEFAQFLPRLARQTIDFEKADAFDPNPTLELLLLVLKNHSQHAHDLLHQLAGLLRAWLPRFVFNTGTLSKILAASTLKKHELISSTIIATAAEILSDGLRGRENVPLPTLAALLDALLIDCEASLALTQSTMRDSPKTSGWSRLAAEKPAQASADAAAFLRTAFDAPSPRFSPVVFDTMRKAGDLLLLAIRLDSGCLHTWKDEDPATSLRLFNLVLLSELTNPIRPSLLHHAITIATATSLSLRSCLPSASRPELPLAEVGEVVNQAFANARLVVLLSTIGAGKDDLEEYWSIVWPSLLRLLTVSEMDGELSSIGAVVWVCFAEWILFLHHAGSFLVTENASAWSSLLNPLRAPGRQDPLGAKFGRAVASFVDPPQQLELEVLVAQCSTEVFVAVKLRQQMALGS